MRKTFKILIGILVFAIILIILASISPQVLTYAITKLEYRKSSHPEVFILPQTRKIKNLDTNPDFASYSVNDVNFKVPFNKKDITVDKRSNDKILILRFPSKKTLIIYKETFGKPKTPEQLMGIKDNNDWNKIKNLYGENSTKSVYAFDKLVYETTPDDLKLWSSRNEIISKFVLIVLKSVILNGSSVYLFDLNGKNGIQLGDPLKDNVAEVQIFDDQNNIYPFNFMGFTQDEIDFTLSTIKFSR